MDDRARNLGAAAFGIAFLVMAGGLTLILSGGYTAPTSSPSSDVSQEPPAETEADRRRKVAIEEHRRQIEAEEARKSEADRKWKAENEIEQNGLALLRKSVKGRNDRFAIHITGTIHNRTGRRLRYAEVTFAVYDTEGAQVATALANISGLEEGAHWNFDATAFTTKGQRYKLTGMNCH